MALAFIIISCVLLYGFIGGAAGAKHHVISSNRAHHRNHDCFSGYSWCNHCYVSVWLVGVLWPIGLPVMLGLKTGNSTTSRTERRRAKEIAEAKHQAELARVKAEEHAALDRELELIKKRKAVA